MDEMLQTEIDTKSSLEKQQANQTELILRGKVERWTSVLNMKKAPNYAFKSNLS